MVDDRKLSAEERRELTVATVIDLAGQSDPSKITTEAIARRMNVTQGALFRHFPSKDAIWETVLGWVADRLLDRLARASAGAASPLAALRAMFMSHVEFVVAHPGVPRMMFGELQRSEGTPAKKVARLIGKRYAELLARRLEEGKAAGEVAPEVDSRAASMLFLGAIQGLVMQSLLSGNIAHLSANAPAVFDIFIRGIERRTAIQQ